MGSMRMRASVSQIVAALVMVMVMSDSAVFVELPWSIYDMASNARPRESTVIPMTHECGD